MSIVQTLLVIFGLLNLAFAGLLYAHSNKSTVITLYALISVFASLWSLSTLGVGIKGLPPFLFIISAYGHYIFGYLAYFSFFWFAVYYPRKPHYSLFLYKFISACTLIFIACIPFTQLVFLQLLPGNSLSEQFEFNTEGYVAFILMLSFVFFAGIFQLIERLRRTEESERFKEFDQYQIYFAILANFVAGVLGITLNLILPLYGNFDFFFINPILVTISLTGIGLYNLLKYNLFNARVVLTEFFTAGIWIVFLARIVLSKSTQEIILNTILFLVSFVFGVFLIRSVMTEIRARMEVERLARELEKTNQRLQELDRQKTEFVSIASHQLRSPLTAIKGYSSLLLEGSYGKLPQVSLDAIKKIFDSSRYMAASIEDFLSVSRIELGTAKYDMKVLSAPDMIKEVTEELIPAATEKHLQLFFKNECKTKCEIVGDIGKLRQVILNLIDNSIKYTPQGSVTVTIEEDTIKRVARIVILDTGVGIPTDVMPTLFKKFSRAKNANEVNVMGTGLGLFVAKQFVEAHKGRVWAESLGQGKGSSFIIELPLTTNETKVPPGVITERQG